MHCEFNVKVLHIVICTLELYVEVWHCGVWRFDLCVGVLHFIAPRFELQIEVVRFELCVKAFKLNELSKSSKNFVTTLTLWCFELSCSSLSSYLTFFFGEILHLCNKGPRFFYHKIPFWSIPLTSLCNSLIYIWVRKMLKIFQNGLNLSLVHNYKDNYNVNGWWWFQFWCSMCITLLVLILWFNL
jgi:hypothetical protein